MSSNDLAIMMAKMEEVLVRLQTTGNATPDEVFLTTDQMERLLRCSPSTLYRLRIKGSIPCVKIGGQYRYPKHFFTKEVINSIVKLEDQSKRFDD